MVWWSPWWFPPLLLIDLQTLHNGCFMQRCNTVYHNTTTKTATGQTHTYTHTHTHTHTVLCIMPTFLLFWQKWYLKYYQLESIIQHSNKAIATSYYCYPVLNYDCHCHKLTTTATVCLQLHIYAIISLASLWLAQLFQIYEKWCDWQRAYLSII